jgi:hypothetical protein
LYKLQVLSLARSLKPKRWKKLLHSLLEKFWDVSKYSSSIYPFRHYSHSLFYVSYSYSLKSDNILDWFRVRTISPNKLFCQQFILENIDLRMVNAIFVIYLYDTLSIDNAYFNKWLMSSVDIECWSTSFVRNFLKVQNKISEVSLSFSWCLYLVLLLDQMPSRFGINF